MIEKHIFIFFQDGGLWIPDAMLAQGYLPAGLFAPGPRPLLRGPRPLVPPMIHPGVFQPRPPRVYNQPYRPRLNVPAVTDTPTVVSIAEVNVTTASTTSNSSSTVDTTSEHVAGSQAEEAQAQTEEAH